MPDQSSEPEAPVRTSPESTLHVPGAEGAAEDTPEVTEGPEEAREARTVHPPVTVDNRTRRSDEDALLGSWVDVVSGQHAGRFGSYRETLTSGDDGYPSRILIRTRDAANELLEVDYSAVRPSERTGGR